MSASPPRHSTTPVQQAPKKPRVPLSLDHPVVRVSVKRAKAVMRASGSDASATAATEDVV